MLANYNFFNIYLHVWVIEILVEKTYCSLFCTCAYEFEFQKWVVPPRTKIQLVCDDTSIILWLIENGYSKWKGYVVRVVSPCTNTNTVSFSVYVTFSQTHLKSMASPLTFHKLKDSLFSFSLRHAPMALDPFFKR
jgi:hypothetical protein